MAKKPNGTSAEHAHLPDKGISDIANDTATKPDNEASNQESRKSFIALLESLDENTIKEYIRIRNKSLQENPRDEQTLWEREQLSKKLKSIFEQKREAFAKEIETMHDVKAIATLIKQEKDKLRMTADLLEEFELTWKIDRLENRLFQIKRAAENGG
jgi:predicted lipase